MTPARFRACVMLILLTVCTVQDVRRREVFVPLPAAGIAAGILITACCRDLSWLSVSGGILAGAAVILFARLSEGAVGAGDGWVLTACGSLCGITESVTLLLAASALMCPVSALLLLTKKKNKTDTVPFVPFLLSAYLLLSAMGGG